MAKRQNTLFPEDETLYERLERKLDEPIDEHKALEVHERQKMKRIDLAPMMRFNTMRGLQLLLWEARSVPGQGHFSMAHLFAEFIKEDPLKWFTMMTRYSPREVSFEGRTYTHGEYYSKVVNGQPSEPVQSTLQWVEDTLGAPPESDTPKPGTH